MRSRVQHWYSLSKIGRQLEPLTLSVKWSCNIDPFSPVRSEFLGPPLGPDLEFRVELREREFLPCEATVSVRITQFGFAPVVSIV